MSTHSSPLQGELWSLAAVEWATLMEHTQRPSWERGIQLAGVGPGTRFFDAGCGAGGACRIAASRQARVTGLDASPKLAEIARERVPSATIEVGEIQALPFADASFDVVFSANAIQYAASPVGALGELCRVLDRRGRLVIIQWGRPEDCDMDQSLFPAVRRLVPPAPDAPQPLALADPSVLDGLLLHARMTTLASEFVDVAMEFADLDLAWRAQRTAGPLQRAIRAVGEEATRAAAIEAMRPYLRPSGMVRLDNKFRLVVAAHA